MKMQTKTRELLDLWYACLIDHHKDRDCYFSISKYFCCYEDTEDWLVSHSGYLYDWEAVGKSYEDAENILQTKLIEQITEECENGVADISILYSEKQKSIFRLNLLKLQKITNH